MKFFVPFAASEEQAERVYSSLQKASSTTYPLLNPERRVMSFSFESNGQWFEAAVGKEIAGWPGPAGVVLAVIPTTQLVIVHTTSKTPGMQTMSILAGRPKDAKGWVYFDPN